jgi:hypothetical protein
MPGPLSRPWAVTNPTLAITTTIATEKNIFFMFFLLRDRLPSGTAGAAIHD